MVNFDALMAEIVSEVWGTSAYFKGFFYSWLRYCNDVTQRKSTKLCTTFGRLLGCYTTMSIYIFGGFCP